MSAAGNYAQQNTFNKTFAEFLQSNTVPCIKPGMSKTEIHNVLTDAVPLEKAFLNFLSEPKQMSYDEFLATKKPILPAGEIRKGGVNPTPRASWKLEKK